MYITVNFVVLYMYTFIHLFAYKLFNSSIKGVLYNIRRKCVKNSALEIIDTSIVLLNQNNVYQL